MDNERFIEAVNEYFLDFSFTVAQEPDQRGSALEHNVHADLIHHNGRSQVPARFISARMIGEVQHEDLELAMIADNRQKFTIRYPRVFLTPARCPADDHEYDLEHLIAENIVFQIDETISYHTVEELDGSLISEFWN